MRAVHGVSDAERQQLWDFLVQLRDYLAIYQRENTHVYGFPASDGGWVIAIIGKDLLVLHKEDEIYANNLPLHCWSLKQAESKLWPWEAHR
jgi:hypothetical protein